MAFFNDVLPCLWFANLEKKKTMDSMMNGKKNVVCLPYIPEIIQK